MKIVVVGAGIAVLASRKAAERFHEKNRWKQLVRNFSIRLMNRLMTLTIKKHSRVKETSGD